MRKLYFLKGLPGSGKSTWAKEYLKTHNAVRINKDDLRAMLHNGRYSRENEKLVLEVRNRIISEAIHFNKDIIVDDTNFAEHHLLEISNIVSVQNAIDNLNEYKIEVKFFDTPLDECIIRDSQRSVGRVGKRVIVDMYNQYLRNDPELPEFIPGAENLIICDIDGTVAKCGDRDIYDTSKVHLDTVIEHVADIVRRYLDEGMNVFFVSGRSDEYRDITAQWLKDNGLWGGALLMRKAGDNRRDDLVKEDIYNEHIKGKYNVTLVIDDRLRVRRMWHRLGLPLLSVGDPDANY